MRIINLVQLIEDYNTFFNILLDDSGISEILEDVAYKFGESGANEGDYFGLEKIRYFKNNGSYGFSLTTLFSFKVISKKYKYIIDEDTGEQVVDKVIEQVVEYLGFN